jgi:hypothetical protein
VREDEIPAALKVILYRVIVLALDDLGLRTHSDQIEIALLREKNTLTLLIDDTPSHSPDAEPTTLVGIDANPESRFAKILELTTLSGGTFAATRPSAGHTILRASWVT